MAEQRDYMLAIVQHPDYRNPRFTKKDRPPLFEASDFDRLQSVRHPAPLVQSVSSGIPTCADLLHISHVLLRR
jgi:hypothetical protein